MIRHEPLRHGYTLAALDSMARLVVVHNASWWPAGGRGDQYAAAWHGIVEALYAWDDADTPPRRGDLMEAGRRALAADVRDGMRHHGARTDSTNNGARYAMYWAWAGRAVPSPEGGIVERLALHQIMAALTPRQREAVHALAATGDYPASARALGIADQTYRALLGRGRRDFRLLWHEGEEPSRPWGCDRRAGAVRGTVGEGSAVARVRRRSRARREAAA